LANHLFFEVKRLFADLAATLILGKDQDAANLALQLAEKCRLLAEQLGSSREKVSHG
jgi:hypothetical protein